MKGKSSKETSVTISSVVTPHDANANSNVHGGVIMYHTETAAGVVASRHSNCQSVTASINTIDFYNPSFIGKILAFEGSLNLVGRNFNGNRCPD